MVSSGLQLSLFKPVFGEGLRKISQVLNTLPTLFQNISSCWLANIPRPASALRHLL